ncbi:hypothetical protein KIOSHI_172 [Bacillus phage Kioshi]|nr:hypothetical protein KIOSHI_172 [Bacillus phage Kioshi]
MSWKTRLNGQGIIINGQVDAYLKGEGFYESTMSPRFFNDFSFSERIQYPDVPCLRLDTDDPDNSEYTMRIFVSAHELYMEVQNSWRSLDRSWYVPAPDGVDIENIDELLDELIGA